MPGQGRRGDVRDAAVIQGQTAQVGQRQHTLGPVADIAMAQVQALQARHRTDLQGADPVVGQVQGFQGGHTVQPRLRRRRDRQLII
ncbi:hypothetical protein D3C84_957350 [compost metagenome]